MLSNGSRSVSLTYLDKRLVLFDPKHLTGFITQRSGLLLKLSLSQLSIFSARHSAHVANSFSEACRRSVYIVLYYRSNIN